MRNVYGALGAIFLSGSVLVSCSSNDGTDGLVVNGVTLPTCELGVGEFAGCWISELCANRPEDEFGVEMENASLRLIEQAVESETHPAVQGSINSYLLRYDGDQCAGDPVEITHLNTFESPQLIFSQRYTHLPDVRCTETGGTGGLSCNAIEITVDYTFNSDPSSPPLELTETDWTALLITGDRLCMPGSNYDFDITANGGIRATPHINSRININLTPGQCLNRFTP